MPEVTDPATSQVARYIMCNLGKRFAFSTCAKCVIKFSTTTTAASTSIPIAIAKPPKLIRLADIPMKCIMIKVNNAAKGNANATTTAALILPKNNISKITTSTIASNKACNTVSTALSTKLPRL